MCTVLANPLQFDNITLQVLNFLKSRTIESVRQINFSSGYSSKNVTIQSMIQLFESFRDALNETKNKAIKGSSVHFLYYLSLSKIRPTEVLIKKQT